MSVAQHVAAVLQLEVQLVGELLDHRLQTHLREQRDGVTRSRLAEDHQQSTGELLYLLSDPPQLVVTIATMRVQVHPERSSENKDFLDNTRRHKRGSHHH